jgi:hypothetical protein
MDCREASFNSLLRIIHISHQINLIMRIKHGLCKDVTQCLFLLNTLTQETTGKDSSTNNSNIRVVILDNNTVAHQTKSSMMVRDRFRFVTKL